MVEITLERVSVDYNYQEILHDLTSTMAAGRLYVVVGPNGAGKSTLLKSIAGLNPVRAGSIRLDGARVSAMPAMLRAQKIAYLPQERSIAWDLPCHEIVALGAQHLSGDAKQTAVDQELHALGLSELSSKGVFSLSGGQRARALIARVMVSPAELYIMDEPLIALDPAWQRQVLTQLRKKALSGRTVIISLHDLQLAAQFADQVILMHEGRIEAVDTPERVFVGPVLERVFHLRGELETRSGLRVLNLESLPLF